MNENSWLSETVRIAVKQNGNIWSGSGPKALARVGGSFSLQSGEAEAIEELFGGQARAGMLENVCGAEGVVPSGYGLVCVDIDAKVVDSHQVHAEIGFLSWHMVDKLETWLGHREEVSVFSEVGMFLDAYMGGALGNRVENGYELLVCKARDRASAGRELFEKFGRIARRGEEFGAFKVCSPDWVYIDRRLVDLGDYGVEEMARSLASRGWPLPSDVLSEWRASTRKFGSRAKDGNPFAGWLASEKDREALEADASVLNGRSVAMGARL